MFGKLFDGFHDRKNMHCFHALLLVAVEEVRELFIEVVDESTMQLFSLRLRHDGFAVGWDVCSMSVWNCDGQEKGDEFVTLFV